MIAGLQEAVTAGRVAGAGLCCKWRRSHVCCAHVVDALKACITAMRLSTSHAACSWQARSVLPADKGVPGVRGDIFCGC